MKAIVPISMALLAGACNIPLIYGFKKAYSQNPFIFAGSFNLCSAFLFLGISYFYGGVDKQYFMKNWSFIMFATIGIFLMNVLAYYIINHYGASYWMLTSLSTMLIPPIFVGYLIFREKLNYWIIPAVICAILTVIFFSLSKK